MKSSALQRAENSSIRLERLRIRSEESVSVLFSEPKIPQFCSSAPNAPRCACFSALQRAENSSIADPVAALAAQIGRFSALQRAENSSIK